MLAPVFPSQTVGHLVPPLWSVNVYKITAILHLFKINLSKTSFSISWPFGLSDIIIQNTRAHSLATLCLRYHIQALAETFRAKIGGKALHRFPYLKKQHSDFLTAWVQAGSKNWQLRPVSITSLYGLFNMNWLSNRAVYQTGSNEGAVSIYIYL